MSFTLTNRLLIYFIIYILGFISPLMHCDHYNVLPKHKMHSSTIFRPSAESSFQGRSCFPGKPWLKSAQSESSTCASLITSPVTPLLSDRILLHASSWHPNWVSPPRLFQTLWITTIPLWIRNHSAHINKCAPREWLLLFWMSNCLHRASFALNGKKSFT